MPIVTTRSVVLQVHRYSDTSKILRLLTRTHGPLSVIARGALRPKSRLSGLLEPFAEGNATFYLKRNRDLHALSGFDLIRERQALGLDMVRFGGASVLCELVLRVAPRQRDETLYDTLIDGLDHLLDGSAEDAEGVAAARIWHLVSLLGFAPAVDSCVGCGRPIEPGRAARFDLQAGGLRCADCPPTGRALTPRDVDDLRALAGGTYRVQPSPTQLALMTDFIRYHASEGYLIRSLDFLATPAR
ncbi:MAG: DNA repair protein RecO [Gemmatimonadota bacterium]